MYMYNVHVHVTCTCYMYILHVHVANCLNSYCTFLSKTISLRAVGLKVVEVTFYATKLFYMFYLQAINLLYKAYVLPRVHMNSYNSVKHVIYNVHVHSVLLYQLLESS